MKQVFQLRHDATYPADVQQVAVVREDDLSRVCLRLASSGREVEVVAGVDTEGQMDWQWAARLVSSEFDTLRRDLEKLLRSLR